MYPGLQGTSENDNLGKVAIHTPGWEQAGQRGAAISRESWMGGSPGARAQKR